MRAIIVDDERLARMELRRLLTAHPEIEIVGEASDVASACDQVRALNPDVLFLDVHMPDGTGFDVLQHLDDAPDVIFTTAFDNYALKAFDANALDYLLKPIAPQRLAQALQKIQAPPPAQGRSLERDGKIFIKDGERCWFVRLGSIALLESEGNYTRVHFDGQRPLLLRSLNQLKARLDPQVFFRASRRFIVNLDHVAAVVPGTSAALGAPASGAVALTLRLNNGMLVDMSRRRSVDFKQRMHL